MWCRSYEMYPLFYYINNIMIIINQLVFKGGYKDEKDICYICHHDDVPVDFTCVWDVICNSYCMADRISKH